ncbi:hypothetical protein [Kitasatospora sp. NBC_01266]|uniref:hypothetical protein n=1 Tax=Kitasatospora sp. NBC_01266 TaxID=2903572 RepID=UPI002E3106C1|nr:hypothetical protein [Kitasatospora sp. NBC_01266]
MTVLSRVLGTTLATGAILLTAGVLPASAAQPTVSGQTRYTAIGYGATSPEAVSAAEAFGFSEGEDAGYTAAQCQLTSPAYASRISPFAWESTVVITCNA